MPRLSMSELLRRGLELRVTSRRGPVYVIAAAMFLIIGTVAFLALPERPDDIRPLPLLVVALVLAPANTVCNAAEYVVTARYAGVRVGTGHAVAIAVLSTAANLLPLPGAVIVRGAALRRQGTSNSQTARVIIAAFAAWLACTALVAGIVVAAAGDLLQGAMLSIGGVAGVAAAHRTAAAHRRPDGVRLTAALVGVESAAVCIGALRLWLCVRGLGYSAGADQIVLLTTASVLASGIGIFPGGLGLREALAAWIAPLVALPSAVGAASSATDRLLGLPILIGALIVVWGSAHRRRNTGQRHTDAPSTAGS